MTRYDSTNLLTPPRKEEEVYPYRRVWPSVVIEVGGVFAITLGLYIAGAFLGITVPTSIATTANLGIALFPAFLWLISSRWRESLVSEPRRGLLGVAIISGLVSNAVAVPAIEALAPSEWLSQGGTVERIIGYTVTIGIIHEALKYLVLRYTVWWNGYRIRLDALAYGMAGTIGYITVFNLQIALAGTTAPDVVAMRVFSNTSAHVAASALVAYGLSEVRFNPQSLLIMPFMMLSAALIQGLSTAARSGLVNSSFFLGLAGTRPLFGMVFSLAVVVSTLIIIAFLFNNAERREREALASMDT